MRPLLLEAPLLHSPSPLCRPLFLISASILPSPLLVFSPSCLSNEITDLFLSSELLASGNASGIFSGGLAVGGGSIQTPHCLSLAKSMHPSTDN